MAVSSYRPFSKTAFKSLTNASFCAAASPPDKSATVSGFNIPASRLLNSFAGWRSLVAKALTSRKSDSWKNEEPARRFFSMDSPTFVKYRSSDKPTRANALVFLFSSRSAVERKASWKNGVSSPRAFCALR